MVGDYRLALADQEKKKAPKSFKVLSRAFSSDGTDEIRSALATSGVTGRRF